MKAKFAAHNAFSLLMSFGKTLIPTLLFFALQGICLAQIYSYTDVSESGGLAIGYGSMSGSYEHSGHTTTTNVTLTSPSGASASETGGEYTAAYLPVDVDGWYSAITIHITDCSIGGTSWQAGSSSGQTQVCIDTCTPCRALRGTQTTSCQLQLGACELLAVGAYAAAIQVCNNQNYCKPDHPDYNQEQCDDCKQTALIVFGAASGACGVNLGVCLNNRVDCENGTYKLNCTTGCTNP